MNGIKVRPIDPLMIRDGRPFEAVPGARAHTMTDIMPSVLAGSIRTLLGKLNAGSGSMKDTFNHPHNMNIHRIKVRGPLYEYKGTIYYPIPQDVSFYKEKDSGDLCVSIRRPIMMNEGEGYYGTGRNGLHEQMWPALSAYKHKMEKHVPAYMSSEWMTKWLRDELSEADWRLELKRWNDRYSPSRIAERCCDRDNHAKTDNEPTDTFLAAFPIEERVHTAIETCTRTAKDKHLFSTESLNLPDEMNLLAEVDIRSAEIAWPAELSEIHSLGGKRGLAHFCELATTEHWSCPDVMLNAISSAQDNPFIRMVLATPSYFSKGWLPEGFNEQLIYENAWNTGVDLQLRWACVPRWQAVSGFHNARGEKAVRRMVPAGSVYFFQVIKGNARDLVEQKWLCSVSDSNRRKEAFDKEDGFGLALWGLWTPMNLNVKGS